MIKRFAFAAGVVSAVAIMITIPAACIPLSVAQQPRINQCTSNPLSLNSIFKQTENSVVNITSKTPTAGVSNPVNQSSNTTTLGSGFVYDKQGHILTNSRVVGDAKVVYVTFPDGDRYSLAIRTSVSYYTTSPTFSTPVTFFMI